MYTVEQSNAQQHSVQYTIPRGTVAAMEKSIRNSKAWNEASGAEQGRAQGKEKGKEVETVEAAKDRRGGKRWEEGEASTDRITWRNSTSQHRGATRGTHTIQCNSCHSHHHPQPQPTSFPVSCHAVFVCRAAPQSLLNHSHTGNCPSFQPLPPPPLHQCTVRHRRCRRRAV